MAAWSLCASVGAATPKRRPQDYGRPPAPAQASHALDWPARVVLFPAWLVFEAVLRQPNGALVRAAENSDTVKSAQDTTSAGPWKQLTVLPAAQFDVGLKPIVGLDASWRYHHNELALQAGTWGPDYVLANVAERYELHDGEHLFVETSFARRKDTPFHGIGPSSLDRDRARYESNALRAAAGYSRTLWRHTTISMALGARAFWFGLGRCCGETNVASAVALGRFTAPGLDQDYGAAFQRADLTVDTRGPRPARGFSLQAGAHEESTFALTDPTARRAWLRYGGMVGASVDVTGTRRVLSLGVHASFIDPLQGQVPFTDQVSLGGNQLMLGFLRGRLVDRSAQVTTVEYTWPFWVFLDGVLHAAVGNVFGEHLQGFDAKALRYSAGVGLRSGGSPASRLEAMLAIGSETFEQGGKVDSVRFMVGTQHVP